MLKNPASSTSSKQPTSPPAAAAAGVSTSSSASPAAAAAGNGAAAAAATSADTDYDSLIEATSQLSRFHLETLSVTSNKALQLQTVNVSVNCKQLLSDAGVSLMPGVRYGLIGKNGVGKSTLLHVLGSRLLVGFPAWLSCMHVEQEVEGSSSTTALQAVLTADAKAQQLQREVDALETALDSSNEQQLIDAVTALQAVTAAATATAANATAAQRSGRRGVAARKAAVTAEQTASAAAATAAGGGMTASAAAAAAHELLTQRYEALAELDADAAEGRARHILLGLGFSDQKIEGPTAALSGGWRMRLALARALFAAPDILCLDEPTNHLDLEAILWLQEYLTHCCEGQTLLVVSHDRSFLSTVCEETIELKDKQLRYFPGPYDAYIEAKAAAAVASSRQAAALDKQKAALQASITAAEKQARQAGDDKKLVQAASRKKKLENRFGLERNAKGGRFKLNRDLVGYHFSKRPEVVLEAPDKPFDFAWPQPEVLRAAGASGSLMQLREVSYTYPGAAAPVLHGVNLNITARSRIALLGRNGAGKSTLMKIIAGTLTPTPPPPGFSPPPPKTPAKTSRPTSAQGPTKKQLKAARGLAVDAASLPSARAAAAAAATAATAGSSGAAGVVDCNAGLRVALFGQHCIEELQVAESALQRLAGLNPTLFSREQDGRDYLGSFGLGGNPSTQPLSSLSGGQKARAALAFLLVTRPQLLLLDEPTNHLDVSTIEALVRAIQQYSGAVVVASHDVRFVKEVVGEGAGGGDEEEDEGSMGEVWVVGEGRVAQWWDGVEAYVQRLHKQVVKQQGGLLKMQQQ